MKNIESEFRMACSNVWIRSNNLVGLFAFLAPLREKNPVTHEHYLHSLRVGLLAGKIARFTKHDERALLMAGALHDLGKCQVCSSVLGKTDGWTDTDTKKIKRHVMDGFNMLRDRFDFTADTIVRHHAFQPDPYPKQLPKFLHKYSMATQKLIEKHARILALADVYDALHRVNDKFGEKRLLTEVEIKTLVHDLNPDQTALITDLYKHNIFSIAY